MVDISRSGITKSLAIVAAAGLALVVAPSGSEAQTAASLVDAVSYDTTTGNQVVTWTFTNT
jgi:hypothetical protein